MSGPRFLSVLLALALGVAACGGPSPSAPPSGASTAIPGWDTTAQHPTVFPLIATSGIVAGQARVMFLFLDAQNKVVSAPDRTASVAFYDLAKDPNTPVATAEGAFLWTIQDERGMYVANVNLPEAGLWGAEFRTAAAGAPPETIRYTFDVLASSPTVKVGDPAPASKTPTLSDVGGDASKISTDPDPDPAFYQVSVAAALSGHLPFVLVFATPKFCVSQQCGPTLDKLKPMAAANPDVAFINVEPYQLAYTEGRLQPVLDADGQLQTVDASNQWGLVSEPWIFTVGADGVVDGSFEGVVGTDELDQAIEAIEDRP